MAEFVDVMRQYNRMFEAHKKGIPIYVEASYETAVKQPKFFEEVVMSWAAEHPVVYPTWGEYIRSITGLDPVDVNGMRLALTRTIPADIAQKLGIKPKEG